ncbi:MAG: tetratricopeptide repeat protein, partial [Chitinophagales bacterium]
MFHFRPPVQFSYLKKSGKKHFLLFICFILTSFFSQAQVQAPPGAALSDNAQVLEYNAQALQYLNTAHYDECFEVLDKAVKKNGNAITYYLLARAYNAEYNWDEAIKAGVRALELDTTFKNTYAELFKAYYNSGKWQDAMRVSEIAVKFDREGVIPAEIKATEAAIISQSFSAPVIMLLLLILAGVFCYPVYKASQGSSNFFTPNAGFRFSEILLLGASTSCILWLLFFAIAHWVWDQHPHINAYDIAVYVRIFIFERDGIESIVLYLLMLVNIFVTLLAIPLLLKIRSHKNIYLTVYSVLFLLAGYYFFKIGFAPPIAAIDTKHLILPAIITLGSVGLYIIYQRFSLLVKLFVVALSAFVGLIALGPTSLTDLSYILDPALRLMHGFKVSEIYFQYDIFLSSIALLWMKMNWDIMAFPYIGQVSFFLFFICAFFFTDKYFRSKGLSVLFLVALLIVRFYTIWGDHPTIFQVTPIRLDLWLILVWVAWKKGIHHWLVGMCLGLLVLFHRNLGLIYLGSYVELLVMMFLLDIIPLVEEKKLNVKSLYDLFLKHLRLNLKNIIVIIASIALCFILFKEMFSASALLYRKLGIGMLPISKLSFYWYVGILYS